MVMQPYPKDTKPNITSAVQTLGVMSRLRDQDIIDRNNFSNIFLSGRTVNRIPSSSTDVSATDRIGDMSFSVDGSYVYFFIDASGTPAWRRVELGTW